MTKDCMTRGADSWAYCSKLTRHFGPNRAFLSCTKSNPQFPARSLPAHLSSNVILVQCSVVHHNCVFMRDFDFCRRLLRRILQEHTHQVQTTSQHTRQVQTTSQHTHTSSAEYSLCNAPIVDHCWYLVYQTTQYTRMYVHMHKYIKHLYQVSKHTCTHAHMHIHIYTHMHTTHLVSSSL